MVDSFEQWRHFLEGSPHQVIIYSDHKNLTYFQRTRVLNRRQARWAQFLTRFDFKIIFCPRKQGKADALSQRSYLGLRPGDPAFDNLKQILLGPSKLQATTIYAMPLDSSLLDTIRQQLSLMILLRMSQPTLVHVVHLAPHCKGHLNIMKTSTAKMAQSSTRISFTSLTNHPDFKCQNIVMMPPWLDILVLLR